MFPLQTFASLLLGFVVWRRFRHTTMFWVWILPCLILSVAFCAISESHRAPLAYFFGSGCSIRDYCFNQVAVTPPVLTSAAYALGAVFARILAGARSKSLASAEPSL